LPQPHPNRYVFEFGFRILDPGRREKAISFLLLYATTTMSSLRRVVDREGINAKNIVSW